MKVAVLKFETIDELLVSYTTAGAVADSDWTDLINRLKDPKITKYMPTSIGTVDVTSVQRKTVAEVLKVRKIQVVVVTEASLVRGLVTAVSWLGANIKAVDWPDIHKGLDHLDVTGSQQERALVMIRRLKATHSR